MKAGVKQREGEALHGGDKAERLAASLADDVEKALEADDPSALLRPRTYWKAVGLGRLIAKTGRAVGAQPLASLGHFHYLRGLVLGPERGRTDLLGAQRAFSALAVLDPVAVPDGLLEELRGLCPVDPADPEGFTAYRVRSAHAEARWKSTRDPSAAQEMVACWEEARQEFAPGHPRHPAVLSNLGYGLRLRLEAGAGAPQDLDLAVDLSETAVGMVQDGPELLTLQFNLGMALWERFEARATTEDLDGSIRALRIALRVGEAAGKSAEVAAVDLLAPLARGLMARLFAAGDERSGHEATVVLRRLLGELPRDAPLRVFALSFLAKVHMARYQRTQALPDLERALALARQARAVPTSDPFARSESAYILSLVLMDRHQYTGRSADLHEGTALREEAAHLLPEDDPQRVFHLAESDIARLTWGVTSGPRSGPAEEVGTALSAGRQAADAAGPEAEIALGAALLTTSERYGSVEYADEGITRLRAAADTVTEMADRSVLRGNLAMGLRARYVRTRDRADIDEAITISTELAHAGGANRVSRGAALTQLSQCLYLRAVIGETPSDLDEAISAAEDGLKLLPRKHVRRPECRSALSASLEARAERDNNVQDLARSAWASLRAVREAAPDHPLRTHFLSGHASKLRSAFTVTGDRYFAAEAVRTFREVADDTTAPVRVRFLACRGWGLTAAESDDWPDALTAYESAVALLPLLAWHGLSWRSSIGEVAWIRDLPGEAAAAALAVGRPERALELLEQARGMLLAQAGSATDELTRLKERDPALAAEMRAVRAALDLPREERTGLAAESPWAAAQERGRAAEERRGLAARWDQLLERARALPGMTALLRGPRIDELLPAGARGPVVVVNSSPWRSDALVLDRSGLTVVPLPELTTTDASFTEPALQFLDSLGRSQESAAGAWRADLRLRTVLELLWDRVAEPVLAVLDIEKPGAGTERPHIWWCPVGSLAFLPLHAAGHHRPDSREPSRNLLDRVTSSYTPTVSALVAARRRTGPPVGRARMLSVGLPVTPGLAPLPHAHAEAERALRHAGPNSVLLTGEQATRSAVMAELPGSAYLHFAGHAGQDPRVPGEAALFCHDHQQLGPLRLADLAKLRLENAELAFLSACESARGSFELPDEIAHLAGALHMAGFQHSFAAQWFVDDAYNAELADDVYEALASGTEPSAALHEAVRRLRERADRPLVWATFTHTGP
ncbi:CHAT domain-containing protein [Streptomyces sp. NPDC057307]|uniref:CHAT domain-containing protein n=1 Tax=Streptomyces sp. NPDC057307 TaxID=3346096 RepID=UPI003644EED1